jgi:hypothetical protein
VVAMDELPPRRRPPVQSLPPEIIFIQQASWDYLSAKKGVVFGPRYGSAALNCLKSCPRLPNDCIDSLFAVTPLGSSGTVRERW